jgi:hypothetical protein
LRRSIPACRPASDGLPAKCSTASPPLDYAPAEYLQQRHRDGLIGYQVVTERSMLAPLDDED